MGESIVLGLCLSDVEKRMLMGCMECQGSTSPKGDDKKMKLPMSKKSEAQ